MRKPEAECLVDGHLIHDAGSGNRGAITEMARITAGHFGRVRDRTGKNDCADWIITALAKIADGQSPNDAFGWNVRSGRQPGNHTWLDSNIADHVQHFIDSGLTKLDACRLIGDAAHKDGERGGTIDTVHTRFYAPDGSRRDGGIPGDMFPIPSADLAALEKLEQRLDSLLEKKKTP